MSLEPTAADGAGMLLFMHDYHARGPADAPYTRKDAENCYLAGVLAERERVAHLIEQFDFDFADEIRRGPQP